MWVVPDMTRSHAYVPGTEILRWRTIFFVLLIVGAAVVLWVIGQTGGPAGGRNAATSSNRIRSHGGRYVADEAGNPQSCREPDRLPALEEKVAEIELDGQRRTVADCSAASGDTSSGRYRPAA